MATQWYYEKSGQWVGPFSTQQLRELALAGRLKEDSELRKGVSDHSILAGTVKNIFSDDKKKERPKQPPPALPKLFLSTPPPIPKTSRSKTPPPLPSKLNTTEKDKIEKEPRSRLLMLVWLAALSFCLIFIAYMLPNERKQVIKWLSKETDSFVEKLSKESKEDVKPKSVSRDTIADTTLQGYVNYKTFADNPSQFIASGRFIDKPLTIRGWPTRAGAHTGLDGGRFSLSVIVFSSNESAWCIFNNEPVKVPPFCNITGTYKGIRKQGVSNMLELVDCRLVSNDEMAKLFEETKPPVPSGARQLKVRIHTAPATPDFIKNTYNASLQNVKCYATDDQLFIDFDVDESKWLKFNTGWKIPLFLRLADRNGNILKYFTTVEKFTINPKVYLFWNEKYQSVIKHEPLTEEIAQIKCELLQSRGNRLVYTINIRDLRDAAIVEVGFYQK